MSVLSLKTDSTNLQLVRLVGGRSVRPHDGAMDSLVLPWVNAKTMSIFLAEVAQRYADEFILTVMDQGGWHIAGDLSVPANMRLLFLPPYTQHLARSQKPVLRLGPI